MKIKIKRYHRGHPWIFSNEVIEKGADIEPGAIVDVYRKKKFIGRGFYNPHSLIAIRMFSDQEQEFDIQFIDKLISRAFEYRRRMIKDNSFRLVFSESDGLPGLIVDKYEDSFVIQVHCYGMELKKDLVIKSLVKFKPKFIYEKSDQYLRKLEGLELKNGLIYGKLQNPIKTIQDGIKFLVDIEAGQKTGFFFDLAEIRRKLAYFSKDKEVLDLFCYTGGFSLYAARGGAKSVIGIDSSTSAIKLAIKNKELNDFENIHFECCDVFNHLRNNECLYDIIILDPPSFTKSRKQLNDARRGYKEINLQAMKRLNKDGLLVTTCCSYHFSAENFSDVLKSAAIDAGFNFRIIDQAPQSHDHPILLNMPEGNYLKCFFLQRYE